MFLSFLNANLCKYLVYNRWWTLLLQQVVSGLKIRQQIFDTLDTDMEGDADWQSVITLIEKFMKKDDHYSLWNLERNL